MKKILLLLFTILFFSITEAQEKQEKINLSYWYVFGRFPSQAELNYWNGQADQSLNWYITNHQNYLKNDNQSIIDAVKISYKDAFGRQPSQGEIDFWSKQKRTYASLMDNHVLYLISDPAENKATINRAYQTVFSRQASPDELNQWARGNCSYALLLACLQSYKTSGYRLQSADAIFNFVKNAWETSSNFVVNTGKAIYNTTVSAITSTVAAAQNILSLVVSKKSTDELQRYDSKIITRTENGSAVILGGASNIKDVSKLINLDGSTLVGLNGATLIAAGGLN
jgi:hypothetical protein